MFESGAVKLRLGGVLLDVTTGAACECRQEVAIVSSAESTVTMLGDVTQCAVCTPDLDQLLGCEPLPIVDSHGDGMLSDQTVSLSVVHTSIVIMHVQMFPAEYIDYAMCKCVH